MAIDQRAEFKNAQLGDVLYCIDSSERWFTMGKKYRIIKIEPADDGNGYVTVYDDDGDEQLIKWGASKISLLDEGYAVFSAVAVVDVPKLNKTERKKLVKEFRDSVKAYNRLLEKLLLAGFDLDGGYYEQLDESETIKFQPDPELY